VAKGEERTGRTPPKIVCRVVKVVVCGCETVVVRLCFSPYLESLRDPGSALGGSFWGRMPPDH
jgi:hypothetical protein